MTNLIHAAWYVQGSRQAQGVVSEEQNCKRPEIRNTAEDLHCDRSCSVWAQKTDWDAELREHVMKRNTLPQLCCGRTEEGQRSVDADHSCLGAVSEVLCLNNQETRWPVLHFGSKRVVIVWFHPFSKRCMDVAGNNSCSVTASWYLT